MVELHGWEEGEKDALHAKNGEQSINGKNVNVAEKHGDVAKKHTDADNVAEKHGDVAEKSISIIYMPQNTRAYRCVHKLKKKYGLSGAIGICQKATKQSYMTGRTLKKKRRKKRRRRRTRRRRTRKKRHRRRRSTLKH